MSLADGPPIDIVFPPGVDQRRIMAPLNTPAWEVSSEYRRHVTRYSPTLFALVYLPEHVMLEGTRLIAFSQAHIDMARAGRRWLAPGRAPRDAWILPRYGAKTTWELLIKPLWALAHGHKRFVMAFTASDPQARLHLGNLRMAIESEPMLTQDYPNLAPLRGRGAQDNAHVYTMAEGQAIAARGIDAASLGVKFADVRPDHLVFDDIEPGEATYSAAGKVKRLASVQVDALPMNDQASVALAGTVTMFGSITHDLVRHAVGESTAPWIREEGFTPHYYPAITTDARGREVSMWPQRWSLEYLREKRGTRASPSRTYSYAFDNRPQAAGGNWWTPELFRLVGRDVAPVDIRRRVMSIDVATSVSATSDYTAVAVLGSNADRSQVVLEYIRQFRITPGELKTKIVALCRANPLIRTIVIEGNQGGHTWAEIIRPALPHGVTLELYRVSAHKHVRLAQLLDHYESGVIVHARAHADYQQQALGYRPGGAVHDDMLDTVHGGVSFLLGESPDDASRPWR
jgi:phage terminase large subunit-like protein